jgi:UDP-3-O-[3-hydroxymyristoyl] glucosamine N-acyltransferase
MALSAPDARFYETLAPVTLGELADLTGSRLSAAHTAARVSGVAVLARAGRESITFLANRRHADQLAASGAGACFISERDAGDLPSHCVALITPTPQAAWAMAAERLHRPLRQDAGGPGIHPDARIEAGALVSAGATVGRGAAIGRGTQISAGVVIGPGVAIGRGGFIGANVSIGFALIGDGARIHAGARIGEPGFGAALGPGGLLDIPQLGRVILQDNVTVGANSCIDRGAWDDTVVGENTKIDNLVQIAHNVSIGRNCVLAAFTGISGSVTIGDGCMLGGRVGVADHVVIGPGARLAAGAGVMKDVPAGQSWGGYPARPMVRWMRETAWLGRIAQKPAGQRRLEEGRKP